ncbi:hypothetical protein Ancab_003240 [Ancistrocladus abbreviatus]
MSAAAKGGVYGEARENDFTENRRHHLCQTSRIWSSALKIFHHMRRKGSKNRRERESLDARLGNRAIGLIKICARKTEEGRGGEAEVKKQEALIVEEMHNL